MAGMPAKCDRCGLVFETKEWGASGPFVQINAGGFRVKCERPGCPGPARIIEGTFRPERDGSITGVSIPQANVAIFLRLRELMDKARASVPSEEELLESVEAISPDLARKIAPLLQNKGVLFVLFVIIWMVSRVNFDVDININELFSHAVTAAEKQSAVTVNSSAVLVTVNVEQKASQLSKTEKQTKRRMRRIRGRTKMHPHKP